MSICVLDPRLRCNDRDALKQSYGFGLGTNVLAALVVADTVKHDRKDWNNIATVKLNGTSGSEEFYGVVIGL